MRQRGFAFFFCVGLCCAGCGGGGQDGTSSPASQYAGTYSGAFIDPTGAVGSFKLVVADAKPYSVTGQYVYPNGPSYAPASPISFTGTINGDGKGILNYQGAQAATFSLGAPGQATTSVSITGERSTNLPKSNGSGTITYPYGECPTALVTLISNPSGVFGGANPFAGSYAGSIVYTSAGTTEVAALNISPSGGLVGTVASHSPTLLSPCEGSVSATGALTLVVQSSQSTASGIVSLANGTISGSLKLSNGQSATISLSQVQPPAGG